MATVRESKLSRARPAIVGRRQRSAHDARLPCEVRRPDLGIGERSSGANWSKRSLTAPPRMNTSGQNSACMTSQVLVHALDPGGPIEILLRARRARRPMPRPRAPCISMCPNSVLGSSLPSANSAVPMPVPKVSMMTVPRRVSPGAPPHLGDARRIRIVQEHRGQAERGARERSAIRADPAVVDVGRRARTLPASPRSGKRSPPACRAGQLLREHGHLLHDRVGRRGLAAWAAMRPRPASWPAVTSTSPPLMDEPPTSMPRRFM